MQQHSIKSHVVISHIRQANMGQVSVENTHPFQRELWGRHWTFAHNGQVHGYQQLSLQNYLPVGSTDSEHLFCWLLGELRCAFPKPPSDPWTTRLFLQQRMDYLHALGVSNMLLSDGEHLYCYCSTKLSWITRRAPFGEACLKDADMQVDFGTQTTPDDIVTVVATDPLTDNEQWQVMLPGSLLVLRDGKVI